MDCQLLISTPSSYPLFTFHYLPALSPLPASLSHLLYFTFTLPATFCAMCVTNAIWLRSKCILPASQVGHSSVMVTVSEEAGRQRELLVQDS